MHRFSPLVPGSGTGDRRGFPAVVRAMSLARRARPVSRAKAMEPRCHHRAPSIFGGVAVSSAVLRRVCAS